MLFILLLSSLVIDVIFLTMPAKGSKTLKRSAKVVVGKVVAKKRLLDVLPIPSAPQKVGQVLVCGQGDTGQLGLGPDITERKKPAAVPTLDNVVSVLAGGMHTVCLNSKGEVITFGCNDEGALGRQTTDDEESTPGKVDLPSKAVQISAGDSHTAALLNDGRIFVWGTFRDSHGPMGLSRDHVKSMAPIELLPGEIFVKVVSGADHLALLTATGRLYTCGCAEQGQLGRINNRMCDRNSSRFGRGNSPLLEPRLVTFKLRLKVQVEDIWAGTYCTIIKPRLTDNIYVCGLNNYGQLGLDPKKILIHFPEVTKAFTGKSWSQICAGPHHTLALDNKGICYALGRSEYGRLGLGKGAHDATELTPIPALSKENVAFIGCGNSTSFAVTQDGKLYSWGMGSNGELGTGNDEDDQDTPILVTGKQLESRKVIQVCGGGQHTVLLGVPAQNSD